MSATILPFRPRDNEEIIDPSPLELAQLEEQVRLTIRTALLLGIDAAVKEYGSRHPAMDCCIIVRLLRRVVREEGARLGKRPKPVRPA